MGEKINIGDYGEISFILRKKRKVPIDGDRDVVEMKAIV